MSTKHDKHMICDAQQAKRGEKAPCCLCTDHQCTFFDNDEVEDYDKVRDNIAMRGYDIRF